MDIQYELDCEQHGNSAEQVKNDEISEKNIGTEK
jgi:hypothetical protein